MFKRTGRTRNSKVGGCTEARRMAQRLREGRNTPKSVVCTAETPNSHAAHQDAGWKDSTNATRWNVLSCESTTIAPNTNDIARVCPVVEGVHGTRARHTSTFRMQGSVSAEGIARWEGISHGCSPAASSSFVYTTTQWTNNKSEPGRSI